MSGKGMHVVVVLVIFSLHQSVRPVTVGATWYQYGSYEYFFSKNYRVNFKRAHSECARRNSSLVVISRKEVQDFLSSTLVKHFGSSLRSRTFYVGLRQQSRYLNSFKWVDGTWATVGYTNWFKGQPNNLSGYRYCVQLGWGTNNMMQWYDVNCLLQQGFICQRRIAVPLNSGKTSTAHNTTALSSYNTAFLATDVQPTTHFLSSAAKVSDPRLIWIFTFVIVGSLVFVFFVFLIHRECQSRNAQKRHSKSSSSVTATVGQQLSEPERIHHYACSAQSSTYLQPVSVLPRDYLEMSHGYRQDDSFHNIDNASIQQSSENFELHHPEENGYHYVTHMMSTEIEEVHYVDMCAMRSHHSATYCNHGNDA
ncbi:uncharacterized protein LOC143470592 isoform X1 [Clavelina lepadiformis]|uniref:uncharacterized protein LOC143470592 isoform X1 n=1 Tax=Clavelina lepadiformis TaxID=159417 RepID=UPI004042F1F0